MASFQFTRLPLELQDKVLEYHFNRHFDLRITQHLIGAHSNAEVGHRRVYAAGHSTHLSILRTSRAVHERALRMLHKSFTGHLDLSSVQYSSKYSMSGTFVPVLSKLDRELLPRELITSIDLGKIEWREALSLQRFEELVNLRTIKFSSSTKGKKSRNFYDVCRVSNYSDFTALFHDGHLDCYFDEMVHARAQRTWKSQSPENPRQIRWELELIGEGCPTINNGLLTTYFSFTSLEDVALTRRAVIDPRSFLRSCEACTPECISLGTGQGKYCHGCTTLYDDSSYLATILATYGDPTRPL